ncbi:MAG: SRPBCC family protein [Calditrichota bacterium]
MCIFSIILLLGGGRFASAEITTFPVRGITITDSVVLPLSPDSAFDIMTGDISPWWDHSFAEHPKAFYIEPKPGGGFFEIFDEAGNGVKHATVIYAERGKLLRFEGPLGLSGNALVFVTTWEYEPAEGGTVVRLTVNAAGQIAEGFETTIAAVWHHFLYDGLKTYVEKR